MPPGSSDLIVGSCDLSEMIQQCWRFKPSTRADIEDCCSRLFRAVSICTCASSCSPTDHSFHLQRIIRWAEDAQCIQQTRPDSAVRSYGVGIVPRQPDILRWVQESDCCRSQDGLKAALSSFAQQLEEDREVKRWDLAQEARSFIVEIDRDTLEKEAMVETLAVSTKTNDSSESGLLGKLRKLVFMSRAMYASYVDRSWRTRFTGV